MKLIVDMNLSPRWIGFLTGAGVQAVHWSTIGRRNAPDSEIMAYAATHGYVVLTHDLDFSATRGRMFVQQIAKASAFSLSPAVQPTRGNPGIARRH